MEYLRKPDQTPEQPLHQAVPNAHAALQPVQSVPQWEAALDAEPTGRPQLQRFPAFQRSAVQRAQVQPALEAARLEREERAATGERAAQRAALSGQLLARPPQEQAHADTQHQADVQRPRSEWGPADWAGLMRQEAEGVAGARLGPERVAEFSALQRQVAGALAGGFRADRGPAAARYAAYGEGLATLQRHPVSRPVAQAVLGLVPPRERPALQRAAAEAAGRLDAQEAQAGAWAQDHAALQRQLAELDEQDAQPVMRRVQARRGQGSPLPQAVQRHLERGLNHDLSGVRVHHDAEAHRLAKGVNALAFTSGSDIYFQSGHYNTASSSGLELLAHEATHTVQQSRGQVGPGIDPDSGLEAEARTMGRRIAQMPGAQMPGVGAQRAQTQSTPPPGRAFGRASASWPGQSVAPAQQGVQCQAGSIQRFGWGSITHLADSARQKLGGAARAVHQAAQSAVQSVVGRVQQVAAPAVKVAQAAAQQVRGAVQSAAKVAQDHLGAVGKTVQEYGALAAVRQRAASTLSSLHAGADALTSGAGRLVRRVEQTGAVVAVSARQHLSQAAQQVKGAVVAAGEKAKQTYAAVKQGVGTLLDAAKQKAGALQQRAQALVQRAQQQAGALGQRVRQGLEKAAVVAKKAATQGWNATVAGVSGFKKGVADRINAIKDSPRFKKYMAFAKEAGIQVLTVGTAIVVGGVVIAGAAALTAATGGLAGPALVMALAASGALSGAASKVVDNALRGKKDKFEGITLKSVATDAALGVALGPLSKVVGGVGRAIGRPLAGLAGRGLTSAGRALMEAGEGLSPAMMRGLRALAAKGETQLLRGAGRARSWASGVSGKVVGAAERIGSSSLVQGAKARLAAVGRGIARGPLGRVFNAVDGGLSRVGRSAAALPERAGKGLSRLLKPVREAVESMGVYKSAARGLRSGTQAVEDRIAQTVFKGKRALSGSLASIRSASLRRELDVRRWLASKGASVEQTASLTNRVFAAGDRVLTSMKTYATAEAKNISAEVREQWYGSSGIGGVIRKEGNLKPLLEGSAELHSLWEGELAQARERIRKEFARASLNEAAASGQQLARREALKLADRQLAEVTEKEVEEEALRRLSGRFVTRASAAYRAHSRAAQTGFDPQKNWLGQLPKAYAAGGRQMWNEAAERLKSLRAAGSFAAGASLLTGRITEEMFITFTGGAAEKYKESKDWVPGQEVLDGGREKMERFGLKNVVRGATGLTPAAQSGPTTLITPFDSAIRTGAVVSGDGALTPMYEVEPKKDEGSQDAPAAYAGQAP